MPTLNVWNGTSWVEVGAAGGYPLGLTGATAATRWVGATTSGAPTTGTFNAKDFVTSGDGNIYVCTAGGSPGTWARAGANADALNSATTVVNTAAATAPSAGQVLTATDSTHATWQTPSASAPVGYAPFALPHGLSLDSTLSAGAALVAAGGTALIPFRVVAPLLVAGCSVRDTDTTLARSWEWRLYREPVGGGATLDELAGLNGSESFTAAAASVRTAAATTPATIQPGVYWLAVRNTHASNTFGLANSTLGAGTLGLGLDASQTKTLGSALGSTLDAVTGWTRVTQMYGARLGGGVFAQTSSY